MGVSVKTLAPALVAAVLVAGGVLIESGIAQPETTARPPQPAQPGQAPAGQPGQPGRGGPGGQGRMINLEGAMRMINRGFRELKVNIGDAAKREENLSAVWMMQQGCAAAKRGKPEHLEGDPAEALDGFRRDQIHLMSLLVELEAAIMDNKTDEAKAAFEEVHEFEEKSHTKYQVEEEEDEEHEGGPDDAPRPGEPPPPPPGR